MVRVTILYPHRPGSRFDVEYYLNTHIPMVHQLLGSAIKALTVDVGTSGAAPGSLPAFSAIFNLTCDTAESFYAAFTLHAEQLQADITNYTNVEPIIQISEVRIG